MRSDVELRRAAGYADRPQDFEDLVRILDTELRLITPTDQDGITGRDQPRAAVDAGPAAGRHYQLTHDYLVRPILDWLNRKQRETRKGRAGLTLEERASVWNSKPENRYLPSMGEWSTIRLLTAKKDWSAHERQMMNVAAKKYSAHMAWTAILIAFAATAVGGVAARIQNERRQEAARAYIDNLRVAGEDHLPDVLVRFSPDQALLRDEVSRAARDPSGSDGIRFRARLAIAPVRSEHCGRPARRPGDGQPATVADHLGASRAMEVTAQPAALVPYCETRTQPPKHAYASPARSPTETRTIRGGPMPPRTWPKTCSGRRIL